MSEPCWVGKAVVLALHGEQLEEHGGRPGLRDENLLESALHRPKHVFRFSSQAIEDLAAAYGYGLIKNHAFIDGNKRVSLVVTEAFLALNGYELAASDVALLSTWLALASGEMSEDALAKWIARRINRAAEPRSS